MRPPTFMRTKMNRKEKVRQKLIKNRLRLQQENKIKNETYFLSKETDKISNPSITIVKPQRVAGLIIPVETYLEENTVVKYKYQNKVEFAKILPDSKSMMIVENQDQPAIECKFKNGRLFVKNCKMD
jgi:hypothetical protein